MQHEKCWEKDGRGGLFPFSFPNTHGTSQIISLGGSFRDDERRALETWETRLPFKNRREINQMGNFF